MITYEIKIECCLKFLISETVKLLGSTTSKVTENENAESLPHLEISEVVLIQCNIANDNYQQVSTVLYAFVPNKSFSQLLDI